MESIEPRLMTVDEFMVSEFFEEGFWELCEGELVRMMSPARPEHELVVTRLSHLFQLEIGDGKCGVYGSNIGLKLEKSRSFVMPDVSVCCDESRIVDGWFVMAPELVVEVLSKGTKEYDLGRKREVYRGAGAKECWIVDWVEGWVEIENFEFGLKRRCGRGETVRSWLFEEFVFGVNEILRRV
jgi:Uma2 family endonuclease